MREHYGLSRYAAQVEIFSVQWVAEIILYAKMCGLWRGPSWLSPTRRKLPRYCACSGELLLLVHNPVRSAGIPVLVPLLR